MKVNGQWLRSVETLPQRKGILVIDQTKLPHQFIRIELKNLSDVATAIKTMQVRGAPLIGAVAAFGFSLAMRDDSSSASIKDVTDRLLATRPTAVNLRWALDRVSHAASGLPPIDRFQAAWNESEKICAEDQEQNRAIGEHGFALLRHLPDTGQIDIMTHCNAGWLGTVDWGTALAPIYLAHDQGMRVHVWVSETRPRNQGLLTVWELAQHGVPHTLITDNCAGYLLQRGNIDIVLVGADRVTRNGDVCNKIGTYMKALAAHASNIPFYAAVPSSTIDWTMRNGLTEIPIEQRDAAEITHMAGLTSKQQLEKIQLISTETQVVNFAFDVTPAGLITGLITERGVCKASEQGLMRLYAEHYVKPEITK